MIREVLLPEEGTKDVLELPAGRVSSMPAISFLGMSGSCSGPGYTALV
jgi:hypothetical protein